MCSTRRSAERSNRLSHWHKLDRHTGRNLVVDPFNTRVSPRRVQAHAGKSRHQLNARKSAAAGLGLALIEQHCADALADVRRIDKERANFRGVFARVEHLRVPFSTLVAAEQGST